MSKLRETLIMVNIVPANRNVVPVPSLKPNPIIASIDIGTNSLHIVVVRIEPTLPTFTVIAKEKETVRLGDRNFRNW